MSQSTIKVEPNKQEIIITRLFDAPRASIFKAYTDPELLSQWWGPSRYTTIVEKLEAKHGGSWKFLNKDQDGNTYAFKGVYHVVEEPENLVYTFEFEGVAGHVALETIHLEDRDGKTFMTDTLVFQTIEDRDGMIASGMESGAKESMDRLEQLAKDIS